MKQDFWMWLAWHLPAKLVHWCHVRVVAHATTGKYSNTVVPELSAMDAGKRFYDDNIKENK